MAPSLSCRIHQSRSRWPFDVRDIVSFSDAGAPFVSRSPFLSHFSAFIDGYRTVTRIGDCTLSPSSYVLPVALKTGLTCPSCKRRCFFGRFLESFHGRFPSQRGFNRCFCVFPSLFFAVSSVCTCGCSPPFLFSMDPELLEPFLSWISLASFSSSPPLPHATGRFPPRARKSLPNTHHTPATFFSCPVDAASTSQIPSFLLFFFFFREWPTTPESPSCNPPHPPLIARHAYPGLAELSASKEPLTIPFYFSVIAPFLFAGFSFPILS